jgi:hypothetical protein
MGNACSSRWKQISVLRALPLSTKLSVEMPASLTEVFSTLHRHESNLRELGV